MFHCVKSWQNITTGLKQNTPEYWWYDFAFNFYLYIHFQPFNNISLTRPISNDDLESENKRSRQRRTRLVTDEQDCVSSKCWRFLILRKILLQTAWPFHDGGPDYIENSPLICRANHWTGFYMTGTSVMKELRERVDSRGIFRTLPRWLPREPTSTHIQWAGPNREPLVSKHK